MSNPLKFAVAAFALGAASIAQAAAYSTPAIKAGAAPSAVPAVCATEPGCDHRSGFRSVDAPALEPGTSATMLAGLAAVLLVVRRRKS